VRGELRGAASAGEGLDEPSCTDPQACSAAGADSCSFLGVRALGELGSASG
jgi:hypothetical protein